MRGSFYEAVWRSLDRATHGNALVAICGLIVALVLIAIPIILTLRPRNRILLPP